MIKNFKLKIKNSKKGTTLIELLVVIAIVALFSMIMVSDYPKIQKKFALSRASYRMAQDLRKALDLGLSGVKTSNTEYCYTPLCPEALGYGIYISDLTPPTKEYKIYADTCHYDPVNNPCYINSDNVFMYNPYSNPANPASGDLIIETVNIGQEEPGVYISAIRIYDPATGYRDPGELSIDFSPPNPIVNISGEIFCAACNSAQIVLGILNDDTMTKTISINKAGLIDVQ